MTIYECIRCLKKFKDKTKYNRHQNRKNPCKIKLKKNNQNNCILCNEKIINFIQYLNHLKNDCKKSVNRNIKYGYKARYFGKNLYKDTKSGDLIVLRNDSNNNYVLCTARNLYSSPLFKKYENYSFLYYTPIKDLINFKKIFIENNLELDKELTLEYKILNNKIDNIISIVNEQKKDILELTQTKQALVKALKQSDSLQETYKKVMQMDSNRLSDVGITFEGNTENEKTREFDLFMNDIDLREDIVTVERKLKDKENIIDLISSKQDSGFVDHTKDFLGLALPIKVFYPVLVLSLVFFVMLAREFLKYLEKYKPTI